MNNSRSSFFVFSLGNPHRLEGAQRAHNGTSNPDRVFSFRGSHDLDLHRIRSQSSHFFSQSFSDSWEHGCSARQYNVFVELFSEKYVTFFDRSVNQIVDSLVFVSLEEGLEEQFSASESLVTNGDDLSIGQFIRLVILRAFFEFFNGLVKV